MNAHAQNRFRRPRLCGIGGMVLIGLWAAPAVLPAGGLSVGREVPVPAEYDARVVTSRDQDGLVRPRVVVVPTKFKTYKTGSRLNSKSVGVLHGYQAASGGRVVRLSFDGTTTFEVRTGHTVSFDGTRYRGMGWRGDRYVLMNLETRTPIVFEARDRKR